MIEWVPIKEFECDDDERQFLILLSGEQFKDGKPQLALCLKKDDYRYHHGYRVSHAAKINFPVEKTLEEKFEDLYLSDEWREPIITRKLAQIAKEHYEGEK